jgi:Zn-dependent protease/CBS domain-containing protein
MLVRGSWRIGQIAGIEIAVHPSWLVIFVIFAISATVLAPLCADILGVRLSTASNVVLGILAALVIFASVVVHEFAHAIVARRLGIPTGNITLFLFGGVASILREPGSPRDEALMAAAGPLASLVLSGLFALLAVGTAKLHWGWTSTLCLLLAITNFVLALFNLLPAFPSDGGRLLRAALWRILGSQARATSVASTVSAIMAGLLVIGGIVLALNRYWNGIWLVLIALFLLQAAIASARQARINLALERLRVGDVMARTLIPVGSDSSLASFVANAASDGSRAGYPVVAGGTFVGLASPRDTGAVPPSLWLHTPVSAVMTPAARMPALSPGTAASDALAALAKSGVKTLPVFEDGELTGVVSEDIIFSALRDREGPKR